MDKYHPGTLEKRVKNRLCLVRAEFLRRAGAGAGNWGGNNDHYEAIIANQVHENEVLRMQLEDAERTIAELKKNADGTK